MPRKDLDNMSREELRNLADSLLWQLRVADAFWFINIEKRLGLQGAEEVNALVWEQVGRLSARDILKRFSIEEKGLQGLLRALKYFSWGLMIDYRIEPGDREMFLSVPVCPAQEGRKKHGLGEYSCKDMHQREFAAFAREVDPKIKVHCVFAPPDNHPPDLYCRWRFELTQPSSRPQI